MVPALMRGHRNGYGHGCGFWWDSPPSGARGVSLKPEKMVRSSKPVSQVLSTQKFSANLMKERSNTTAKWGKLTKAPMTAQLLQILWPWWLVKAQNHLPMIRLSAQHLQMRVHLSSRNTLCRHSSPRSRYSRCRA